MQRIVNLLVLGALICIGWYGYSNWVAASADPSHSAPDAEFNCRQALATLAEDYACRESGECKLTDGDVSEIRQLERRIEQHCN